MRLWGLDREVVWTEREVGAVVGVEVAVFIGGFVLIIFLLSRLMPRC